MRTIIVIGGGASGMMAAGQAAASGTHVILLEKMKHPGNKIRISGKGRCNLTNDSDIHDFISHFNRAGRFLYQPFSQFFVPQLMAFFKERGVSLVTERGRRVFPASGNSSEIVDCLVTWLNKLGVDIRTSAPAQDLIVENGAITGVKVNQEHLPCEAVILATGGKTYPATGSTGDGFSFVERVGHTITPLRPALVPLEVEESVVRQLAGLDLKNVGLRIYVNGKRCINDFGEMGFTRFGIGGPVVLTHSLYVVDCLRSAKKVTISLDLKPALDDPKLDRRLLRDFQQRNKEPLHSVLRGLLPKQLSATALYCCDLDGEKKAGTITARERTRLRTWLKDFRLNISGYRPLSEAIITAGGINVNEINPQSMESKKITGLYITGELLDINGETGGYNLQAAFSTGWLAGRSAAGSTTAS